MPGDVEVGSQLLPDEADELTLAVVGPGPGELVVEEALGHVLGAREAAREAVRQGAAKHPADPVDTGTRDDGARRALEHDDMRGAAGHGGHEGDGGGAAADDDEALAFVVERYGPELRMEDPAAEAIGARELRRVTFGIAVVAAAHQRDMAAQAGRLAFGFDVERLARVRCGEIRPDQAVAETDMAIDAVAGGGFADIAQDGAGRCEREKVAPGAEAVAEGVHVGVRPHAG